ncbi:hypothetical protein [Streptomyces sp. NRRL S-378]|uniref:hypothetical protein n=1 Tax=Streptomyces sp. NRRL S-378 TaxID=1463904 RepID=UPI00131D03B6|nr:hypothetical protein [Streptomyces sp. NRRL S-378]
MRTVHPAPAAEISADRAIDHDGIYRQPLRFQRPRLDAGPEGEGAGVPGFGRKPSGAAG